jgi:hypothetical protein
MSQSYVLQEPVVPSLGTLYKDVLLTIFEMLEDMRSIAVMVMTCKYFKSIWKSIRELHMYMYCIEPKNAVVGRQLLDDFEYALKSIFRDLDLRSWLKFESVVQGRKTESSLKYLTKALFWISENKVTHEILQTLRWFVSECPRVSILFLKGNSALLENETPGQEDSVFLQDETPGQVLKKLHSLKYLCISDGSLNKNWPRFIKQFKELKWVYFRPRGSYNGTTTWKIDTQEIVFIMDSVEIEFDFGNIE